MITHDTDALRKIAEAALGEEPWTVVPYGDGDSLTIHEGGNRRVCFMATSGEEDGAMDHIEAKASHIVAFGPAIALALLDRLEAAESLAQAQTNSTNALRAEAIDLRNQIAILNGKMVAREHGHE